MKKTFLLVALAAVGMAMSVSCSKETESAAPATKQTNNEQKSISIAFVDLDSLTAKYQYYLDCSEILEKKKQSINSTLNNKMVAFQKEAADFQDKIQKGSITEEQALKLQSQLQNKQTQLQNLEVSLNEEFLKEQDKYNKALHDSVDNFLQAYNKTAGYTYILSRSNDNILLADPKCDITQDVIDGLNKRYKKK